MKTFAIIDFGSFYFPSKIQFATSLIFKPALKKLFFKSLYKNIMDGQKVWNTILSEVKPTVSSSNFKTWFSGAYVMDYKNDKIKKLLIIGLKNNFLKEQVESRYADILTQVAKKNFGDNVEIVFIVSQKISGEKSYSDPLFSGVANNVFSTFRKPESINPIYTFENFAVGPSNNLAYVAAKQVCINLGTTFNPLMIYGPTGVGKTHLLQAIGSEVLSTFSSARVMYVSCEKFTNDFIEAISNKTQAVFRQKYRSADMLLVDDVQFLAGKESTQDEFFYTFNEMLLSGRQVVIVSDKHPQELGKVKDRLVSRFLGGMSVDLTLPDYELKVAILKSKCKLKKISLSENVVSQIAAECSGGARELEGVLVSVLAKISLGGNLGSEDVSEVVKRTKKNTTHKIDPKKIISGVCEYFGVSHQDLCGLSRKSKYGVARQYLVYLLRNFCGLSYSEIGKVVGGRDHSTIVYSVSKFENKLTNKVFNDEFLRIKEFLQK